MSSVDVIIPCYNYAHFLRGCVQSVLSQENVDVRVLIIDDCSPDNTPDVGRALAAEDSRVEYRRHAVNKRHIATYNEGIEWLSGDYALLLSADDYLVPGALSRAARIMDAHPEVAMTYGPAIKVYTEAGGPSRNPVVDESFEIVPGPAMLDSFCRTGENLVPTPSAVVRAAVQKQAGGYCPELPHAGDLEMWMRFAAFGSIAVLKSDQAFYRFHGSNMHVAYFHQPIRDLHERKAAFDHFFDVFGSRVENSAAMKRLAYVHLGWSAFWTGSRAMDAGSDAYKELIDYSLQMYPDIVSQPEWSRFRWKQRIGPKVRSLLLPIARYVRSRLGAA